MRSWATKVAGQRDHSVLGRASDGMTVRQALELVAQRKAELRRNAGLATAPASQGPRTAFSKAIEVYLSKQEEEGGKNLARKRMHMRLHLVPYFHDIAVGLLNDERLKVYRQHRRQEKASDSTINRELASLSHFVNWCASGDRKWIPRGHCTIPRTREDMQQREVLTGEEGERLLEAALHDVDPLCYLFVAVCVLSPMRHSEILRMRWEDIDAALGLIRIPRAKAGARQQHVPPRLLDILEAARLRASDPQGWVFPNRRPAQATHEHVTTLGRAFKRVARAAGLDPARVTPHLLRHSAASRLAAHGLGEFMLMKITGHKSASMARRYVHLHGPQVQAAAALLDAGSSPRNSPDIPPSSSGAESALPQTGAQVIAFPKKVG